MTTLAERFERLDDEVPLSDEEVNEILTEAGIGPAEIERSLQRILTEIRKLKEEKP